MTSQFAQQVLNASDNDGKKFLIPFRYMEVTQLHTKAFNVV